MDQIWCLQQLGKFKILAIRETHLDKAVTDSVLDIEGMKFIQLEGEAIREVVVCCMIQMT